MLVSFSNNPPNGRTGAPGDGLCTDCHSPSNPPQDAEVIVTGIPEMIAPSTTYNVTVTVRNPNGQGNAAGFQMTILNADNNAAGTMDNPDQNSAVTSASSRQYFEHNPSLDLDSNNEASWSMEWTSPAGPLESPVIYYVAGNVVDGGGSNANDRVVTLMGDGIISNVSSTRNEQITRLNVFPNPTSDVLQIESELPIQEISFFTLDGRLVQEMDQPGQNIFDVSNYETGMYLVRTLINDQVGMAKWMKE